MASAGRSRVARGAIALLASSFLVAAGAPGALGRPATGAPTSTALTASAAPAESTPDGAALERRLRAALGDSADDVSVAVHDRRSGRTLRYNAALENSTGSIVKALVLTTLLREKRADGASLTSSQRGLAERMIHQSDNDATTSLLRQAGGRAALDRTAKALGMTATHSAGSWGRTATTAPDQLRLMNALVDGHPALHPDDRAYALDLMSGVAADQRWGAGTVPQGVRARVKNGWVPLSPRGWRVNSIGHVSGGGRDYTIAMLSYDNASMEEGVDHLDRVSAIVYDALGPSGAAGSPGAGPQTRAAALFAPRPLW